MNTLKKTVAVVLAVAMVLTMGIATSFASFTDVQDTAGYAEAVNILSALGIIEGYEDGTFKPNNTITRAEVAAIMVRVLDADPIPGATPFDDVPADHWASGYINTAYSLGIINGYGNGNFGPGNNVLYEQAVKMIVCALGYEPALAGDYPTGYLQIAASEDISTNANGTAGQPATRATVARLVYNALTVPMMNTVKWGGSGKEYANDDDTKTLLAKLGISKLDVVVSDNYYTEAAKAGEYNGKDKTIKLTSTKKQEYNGEEYLKDEDIVETFVEGDTAAGSLLGYACVAYVGEDDETGDHTIYAITAKGSKNTVTTVSGERLATLEEVEDDTATEKKNGEGTVYYWRNGRSDRKMASIAPDDEIKVYVNYEEDKNFTAGTEKISPSAGTDFKDAIEGNRGGVVQFIDNDGDGAFNVALISQYTKEGVVGSVRAIDGEYSFRKLEGSTGEVPEAYDPEEEGKLKLFVKDEEYIEPSDIVAGDTITVVGDEDTDAIIVYRVSSEKIEGKSSSYDDMDETLTVAGKAYTASPAFRGSLEDYKNKNGVFYFNADGLLAYVDVTSAAVGNYGYVVAVREVNDWKDGVYEIRIVDNQGVTQTYTLKDEFNVYETVDGNANDYYKATAEDIFNRYENVTDDADRIIKYRVSGNTVDRITFASSYEDIDKFGRLESEYKYDGEDHTFGSSDPFTENTLIFSVGKDDNDEPVFDDPEYITVNKGYGSFIDDDNYNIVSFAEDGNVVAAIQISTESKIAKDGNVFVVTNIKTDVNEDDEDLVVFTGIQNGETTSFTLYDDEDDMAFLIGQGKISLGKGTVLMVGPENGGFVDKIEILVEVTRSGRNLDAVKGNAAVDDTHGRYSIVSGFANVEQQDDDGDMVYVDSKGRAVVDGYTHGKGYAPSNSTNVVAVDFSGNNYASATVKSSDFGFLETSKVDDYAYVMFFRAYDTDDTSADFDLADEKGNVEDVVIYKIKADDADLIDYNYVYNPDEYDDNGGSTQSWNSREDDDYSSTTTVKTPVDDDDDAEEEVPVDTI